MDIETYNLKCYNILKDIKEADGMYNYYNSRINKILKKDDELLIEYFLKNVDKNSNIIEIAAGIGQVSHYLNINGFNNITVNECDKKRFNLAKLLNQSLNNTVNLNCNFYQKIHLDKYDYIFCLNGVSSHLGKLDDIIIFKNLLNNGKKIILKEGYFGITNDTVFTDKLKETCNFKILFETNKPIVLFYK